MTDSTSTKQSLTVQTFWFATAKTIAFALSIVFPFLLVRCIDRTEFGLYKQTFLIAATALRMLTVGFGLSAFYFFPRSKGREAPIAANIVLFNFTVGLFACAALLLHPELLVKIFNGSSLVPYAPLIGVLIFLQVFSSFVEVGPAAMQDTAVSTMLIIGVQLSRTVFMLAALFWSTSLKGLLWGAILQAMCQSGIMLVYLQRKFPGFLLSFSFPVLRTQILYVLPLSFAYFIAVLQGDIPQYIVANHFSPAVYAIYATGTFTLPLMSVLHESVGMVMIPLLSRLHHEGRIREIIVVQANAMRKMAAITLPAYFYLLVVSREFITLLYTSAYRESASIFAVNLALLPLMIIIYDPLMRVYDEMRSYMVGLRFCLLIFLAIAVTAGARRGNLTAAIWAVVLSAAIERFAIGWKLVRTVGLTSKDRALFGDIGKFAACSVLAGVITFAVRSLVIHYHVALILAICGVVYGVIYAGCVFLFRIPRPEEYAMLTPYLRRLGVTRAWAA